VDCITIQVILVLFEGFHMRALTCGVIALLLPALLALAGCSRESGSPQSPTSVVPTVVGATPDAAASTPAESPTPAASSRLSLDWAGTYSGVIPCASCPGIETVVTLRADGTFERSARYIDERPTPIVEAGFFTWNAAGSIVSLSADESELQRYQVGENRLFHLDMEGRRIEGALADSYILYQHLRDPALEDRRWLLTELNGQPIAPGEHGKQAFVLLRSEDSRVTGTASCNTFNGSYAIKGGQRIEFGHNIAMTLMACQDLDVERQFIDVLKSVDNYSVDGAGGMTFNRARIAPLARFVEAGEAE
jgi:uncharacterized lipoprotein NlpE involved in copper resistance